MSALLEEFVWRRSEASSLYSYYYNRSRLRNKPVEVFSWAAVNHSLLLTHFKSNSNPILVKFSRRARSFYLYIAIQVVSEIYDTKEIQIITQ